MRNMVDAPGKYINWREKIALNVILFLKIEQDIKFINKITRHFICE
jgi:hypothetical protein